MAHLNNANDIDLRSNPPHFMDTLRTTFGNFGLLLFLHLVTLLHHCDNQHQISKW